MKAFSLFSRGLLICGLFSLLFTVIASAQGNQGKVDLRTKLNNILDKSEEIRGVLQTIAERANNEGHLESLRICQAYC